MNYGSSAGQVTAAPSTVRPIPGAFDELESNLSQLQEVITALQDRLAPLLGSSKPTGVPNDAKGPQALPTVANRIYGNASSARMARERIGDLLDRLEL